MNTLFDKLNLRPQERRLVMVAGVVLFVVLNVWLVIPHFNEWKDVMAKLEAGRGKAVDYERESKRIKEYNKTLDKMRDEGAFISQGDRALDLVQTINNEAAAANIVVQRLTPAGGGAVANNPFFEEQRVTLSAVSGEKELVNFLQRLGVSTSLVRVRDLDIKLDTSGFKLAANMTIVGNYLKKSSDKKEPAKPAGPVFRKAQPTEKK